jgi:ABC-type transport system involved in Fe-S cluster assembly fused permease/ATPase subunit
LSLTTHDSAEVGAPVPASAPWAVRMRDVTVRYPNGVVALNGITLDIEAGEMVSVVGLSGSGKSSMIRTINGLVPITSGSLDVGGHALETAKGRQLRRLRGEIGMIFQGFNLAGRTSRSPSRRSTGSASSPRPGIAPPPSPADSSSASPSPAPSRSSRTSCSPTSRWRASTRPPRTR